MMGRLRRLPAELAVPVFLLLATLLGGASREAPLPHAVLHILAGLILIWCVLDNRLQRLNPSARWGVALAVCIFAIGGLQLVPLPPALWTALPAREEVASGFQALGMPLPWMPLSLAPEETLKDLFHLLPPLAMFMLICKLRWKTATAYLGAAILLAALASVLLGLYQLFDGRESAAYVYETTNRGFPVGVFANVNHQATLTLMTLPFIAALAGELGDKWNGYDSDLGLAILLAAAGLMVATGVMIAGSGAGYLMFVPVLALCIPVFRGRRWRGGSLWRLSLAAVLVLILSAVNVALSPILADFGLPSLDNDDLSRLGSWSVVAEILQAHFLFGTGLGSFQSVFALYENPDPVVAKFVNHAHNDYLEWLMEAGLAGALLLLVALAWWGRALGRAWTHRGSSGEIRLKRAAAVATLVIALHSIVDYPSRTPAIAVFGALCVALMVKQRGMGSVGRPQSQSIEAKDEARSVSL